MSTHIGAKAEPVVRLAKTRITCSTDDVVNRLGVAIRSEKMSPVIHRHPKRIDLATRPDFQSSAIRAESVGMA